MKSIKATLDLGNGISVAKFNALTLDLKKALDDYNTLLSEGDAALNRVVATEKSIRDVSERLLAGVASRYGKDSDEYEKAGGTRKSERKKPIRKKTPTKG